MPQPVVLFVVGLSTTQGEHTRLKAATTMTCRAYRRQFIFLNGDFSLHHKQETGESEEDEKSQDI